MGKMWEKRENYGENGKNIGKKKERELQERNEIEYENFNEEETRFSLFKNPR